MLICQGQKYMIRSTMFVKQLFRQFMPQQIYLMRHAESVHNREKKKWKKQHSNAKHSKKYTNFKVSPHLKDPQVLSIIEIRTASQYLDQVDLIITSPLKRCLQTARECSEITGGRVLVEPLLNSRFSAAWSVGTPTSLLKLEYPEFDFSFLEHLGEYWMRYFLGYSSQEVGSGQEQIGKILRLIEEDASEPYVRFERRVSAFRNVFLQQVHRNSQYGYSPKILIISHNCVMNILCGRSYELGKIKDKINFKHCSPVRFSFGLQSRQQLQPKL